MQALPHETVRRVRLRTTVVLIALVQPVLLILFLIASLIWTGGQVLRDQSAPYDQILLFPVVPVPGWLLLVLAGLLAIGSAVYCVGTEMLDARSVVGLLGPVLASCVTALFFFAAQPVEDDPNLLVALIVDVVALIPLAITAIRFVPEYERRRQADTLPEGYV